MFFSMLPVKMCLYKIMVDAVWLDKARVLILANKLLHGTIRNDSPNTHNERKLLLSQPILDQN